MCSCVRISEFSCSVLRVVLVATPPCAGALQYFAAPSLPACDAPPHECIPLWCLLFLGIYMGADATARYLYAYTLPAVFALAHAPARES